MQFHILQILGFLTTVFSSCLIFSSFAADMWDVEIINMRSFDVEGNLIKETPTGLIAYPQQGSYPDYKERSQLYDSATFKAPYFQTYSPKTHSHLMPYSWFLMHVSPHYMQHLPTEILQEIDKDNVKHDSVIVLVAGQATPWKIEGYVDSFCPSYAIDPLAPNKSLQPYSVARNAKCMLFNDNSLNVEFYKLPNDNYDIFPTIVSTVKDTNDSIITSTIPNKTFIIHNNVYNLECNDPVQQRVYVSPAPLGVKGIDKNTTKSLYSYVTWTENFVKKAVVTLHVFVDDFSVLLEDQISGVKTTENLINIFETPQKHPNLNTLNNSPLKEIVRLLKRQEKPLKKIKDSIDTIYQPKIFENFNPELYIELYPGLISEAKVKNIDPIEYARWHYTNYGCKHGLHYLPPNFNPELYLELHPGVLEEAQQKEKDPADYAKWHYSFYGYKGLNYLPYAFNPKLYLQLHPGVLEEAEQKERDPVDYAKWQYAFYGYKGLNYLPYAFNPKLYLQLHPGVLEEAQQKEKDPVEYAKWQYAFYGYKGLNYLPIDFDANVYLELHPGVLEEANQKGINPAEYAKWQYAFYGYTFLPYKK